MRTILVFLIFMVSTQCILAQSPFVIDSDSTSERQFTAEPAAANGPPVNGSSEDVIEYYGRLYSDPDEAWGESLADRNRIDPTNIAMRDAEHYWWARAQVQNAPGYAKLYKAFQQGICTIGYSTYKLLRAPITGNTTPPSFREMEYGLKGAWDGLFPPR